MHPQLLRGIIPGPHESEESFFQRVKSLDKQIEPPSRVQELFGLTPDWIKVEYSSKNLRFWEGAALWIEGNEKDRSCHIQIGTTFFSRHYDTQELLSHEMVHAMRLMFDEPKFEEILAYQTSKNRFRRYCGPLFSSPKESLLCILLFIISWVSFMGAEIAEMPFSWGFLAFPFLFLGKLFLKVAKAQRTFTSSLEKIKQVAHTKHPLGILLCLTDKEIQTFSTNSLEEIRSYALQEKSIRWRLLHPFFAQVSRGDI